MAVTTPKESLLPTIPALSSLNSNIRSWPTNNSDTNSQFKSIMQPFSDDFSAWLKSNGKAFSVSRMCDTLETTLNKILSLPIRRDVDSLDRLGIAVFKEMASILGDHLSFEQLTQVNAMCQDIHAEVTGMSSRPFLTGQICRNYTSYARVDEYLHNYLEQRTPEIIIAKYRELYKSSLSGDKDAINRRIQFENEQIKPESALGSILINQLPGAIPPGEDPSKFINTQKQKEINTKYLL